MCQKQRRPWREGAWEINLKKQNNLIININKQPKNSFLFEHSLCCLLCFYVLFLLLLLLLSCCISMFCGRLCEKRFWHLHTMFSIKGGMKCITYTQWLTMQISPGQTWHTLDMYAMCVFFMYFICILCWVALWHNKKIC